MGRLGLRHQKEVDRARDPAGEIHERPSQAEQRDEPVPVVAGQEVPQLGLERGKCSLIKAEQREQRARAHGRVPLALASTSATRTAPKRRTASRPWAKLA